MDLHSTYPGLSDLRAGAKKRIPSFVWEYLDSGTGDERTKSRNRTRLDQIGLMPSVLHGEFEPDLSTTFLGKNLPKTCQTMLCQTQQLPFSRFRSCS